MTKSTGGMCWKGAGNFGTLHLSTRIREYLTYKAWKEGILVLDVNAKETHRICAICGSEITQQDKESKRFVCEEGHQGDAYLNVARNAAKRCMEQFRKKAGKRKMYLQRKVKERKQMVNNHCFIKGEAEEGFGCMCRDFWVEHRLSRLICRMVKSGREKWRRRSAWRMRMRWGGEGV
ncbi:MAG: zinc ribbon domain-containing protein [Coprococcus sp.]